MDLPAEDGAEAPQEGNPEAEGPEGSQRPAGQWSGVEVGSWLAAHGGAAELAREHALTGRGLLRLTEGSLRRMGVAPRSRRRELLRELLRLRLQQEVRELRSIAGVLGGRKNFSHLSPFVTVVDGGFVVTTEKVIPERKPSQSEDDVPVDVPEPVGAEEMACEDKAAGTEQDVQERC
ncbi:sterile alpha motif domain-containing protein 12-like [Onychostruthus taczanowskii]|uniref:sterile alpha motif domain-containing protein 12-like n=1 Tax=Onychostruthus taczanowskii TaxID=356909 RepID=UPI001B806148|nr:sterile alpha motif domain-containing protein 12-like [Onychostruthus taczanowskii]